MSRLDSLSGALFRPTQQAQGTASAEKVSVNLPGRHEGKRPFHQDGFDRQPRQQDPGFYGCSSRLPNPGEKKEDPGFYGCASRLPNPGEKKDPGVYGCASRLPDGKLPLLPGLPQLPQFPKKPLPEIPQLPLPELPKDPGVYGCSMRVPEDKIAKILKDLGIEQ